MPFAAAQIGMGFRNEISPRQGLLRVREFTMAEIEHFVDPTDKSHPKFASISHLEIPLFSAQAQEEGKREPELVKVGDAVGSGMIGNQTLAYFVSRTFEFLVSTGLNKSAIRFRQHRSNEMAHYANDCWDAEVETSYGWIEVAGHSDRSAFDLTRHMNKTKVELNAARRLKESVTETFTTASVNKQVCGKVFKKDNKLVCDFFVEADKDLLGKLSQELAEKGEIEIESGGKTFKMTSEHITFNEVTATRHEEKYVPHVIEPSFGIGRILYCIFEHCFKVREKDEQRTYFDFPPAIAPLKTSILPLMNQPEMNAKVQAIKKELNKAGVSSKVDDSGVTVGKRYARTDECGIPYAITVDQDTFKDDTVTLRQLDSMNQIRLPVADLTSLLQDLTSGVGIQWNDAVTKYGLFNASSAEQE